MNAKFDKSIIYFFNIRLKRHYGEVYKADCKFFGLTEIKLAAFESFQMLSFFLSYLKCAYLTLFNLMWEGARADFKFL